MTALSESPPQSPVRAQSKFYLAVAAVFVLVAFGGFIPTYWARLADGSFHGNPILHVHGAILFSWTLFFLAQSWMAATGRIYDHRQWGMFGVALISAMGFTVVASAINSIKAADAMGMGDAARRFSIVSLSALVVIWGLVWAAIAHVHKPETHKRFMVAAIVPMMEAAMARVFMTVMAPPDAPPGPPPVFVTVAPSLVVDMVFAAMAWNDIRTTGKIHPATMIGAGVVIGVQAAILPLAGTDAWMSVARAVEALAG